MIGMSPRLTSSTRALIVVFVSIFVLQMTAAQFFQVPVSHYFGFSPLSFFTGSVWQIITYAFLHGSLTHVLFNCLAIFMLGAELERYWGTKKFLIYFFTCSVGGAFLQTFIWLISLVAFPEHSARLGSLPIIGASGALYGLFMAFGRLFGDAQMLVFFVFPMKARQFVYMLLGIEIFSAVFQSESGVAHLVHLGGLFTGWLLLKFFGDRLNGGGGGPWFGRRKKQMTKEELKSRLSVITNADWTEPSGKKKDGKYPITWN